VTTRRRVKTVTKEGGGSELHVAKKEIMQSLTILKYCQQASTQLTSGIIDLSMGASRSLETAQTHTLALHRLQLATAATG